MLTIVVNGVQRSAVQGTTLTALVAELDLQAQPIAVERNREIVPKSEYEGTTLEDGDQLEIVTFVGGG